MAILAEGRKVLSLMGVCLLVWVALAVTLTLLERYVPDVGLWFLK